ncbi:outer membrane protein assembly factor BamA [Roseicyclus sp. F158]|uniref:Outer membrane protein assembly factor BamA n=1 Tax=Tropicimonas omnivorans TaxID=3075590 RepID=A0ABU3DJV4_9RHOB|nr:outer membrane protein assembly factor BamA [Roseicyclus sp. F158]MDT0683994.1 outer membrane protein assembly factor BamA [Roseicyclus sp. F158]
MIDPARTDTGRVAPFSMMRKHWSRLSSTCAVACLTVSLAVTPAGAQSYQFSTIDVQGNERVDDATVASYTGIGRGQTVSGGALNDAYQALLQSGLFESVDLVPQGSTLVIRVQEWPTVNVISFEGNRRIDDEQLGAIVESQTRRVFSPAQAERDAAAIAEGYRQSGRLAASVEPRVIRRDNNRVDLVFEITEGRVSEIERISFVGNDDYSDRRLRRVLGTKQAGLFRRLVQRDTLVEERLAFDQQVLRDFYLSRGYVDFRILSLNNEVTRDRGAVLTTYNIQEGQQFRVGGVSVSSEIEGLDTSGFREAVRLKSGVVYSPAQIENDIARLETLASRQGLNFIRVDPRITRNDRDLTLNVEYAITRGERIFVERIDIEGNTTTLDRVIRRQFDTVEGDPFNPREIREAAERIRALGFFANANVEAREGTSADQVIVDVDVEEQPTGSLGFGASYSTNSGVGFNISFAERNFLGRGQSLSVDLNTTGATRAFGFDFTEPAFLGRDVAAGLSAYYRESDNDNARYNTRRASFSPSLSFPVSLSTRLGVRFDVNYGEVFGVDQGFPEDSDDPDDTGSSAILRAEEDLGEQYAFSLGYTVAYSNQRVSLDPNMLYQLRFSQDFGVRDEATFIKTEMLARARKAFPNPDVNFLAEFEAGVLAYEGGDSRIIDRFTLNGKMRGFEPNGVGPRDLNVSNEDALGGNIYAVARFEADFPLGLPEEYGIAGGVFADVGSVWSLDNTGGGPDGDQEVDDGFALRSAAGVALFWDTPIGPLRFNFSRPIQMEDYDEEQNFELTVSTRF